jgi:acetyltransferase
VDINPIVISQGKATAVDARVVIDESVLAGKPKSPHLVITPYPSRYVMPWRLTDGTEVLLRPIKPEDEPMEAEMLRRQATPEALLRNLVTSTTRWWRFTNIDYDREMAIVEYRKGKRLIGVGRLCGPGGTGRFAVVSMTTSTLGPGLPLTDVIGHRREKPAPRQH